MEIYYVNHQNAKINLMRGCYNIESSTLFNNTWNYDSSETSGYNGTIDKLKKGVQDKSLIVHIASAGLKSGEQAFDEMMDVFETDVLAKKTGRLYVDDYYLDCFITGTTQKNFVPGIGCMSCELEIAAERFFWIKETTYSFLNQQISSSDNKWYPYQYGYRYANGLTNTPVINDHFADSDFRLTIYGPVVYPQVTIGDHTYLVYTILQDGEYLEIDSRTGTIYKVTNTGEKINEFHNRKKSMDFFKKIPSGRMLVKWPNSFGFDLIIYEERSIPKWLIWN